MPKSFPKQANGLSVDAVAGPLAIDFTSNQAGIFQNFQVLGNRCLGQWHQVDNLTTNTGAAKSKGLQYLQPGWMRKRLSSGGQGFKICYVLFGSHMYIVHRR